MSSLPDPTRTLDLRAVASPQALCLPWLMRAGAASRSSGELLSCVRCKLSMRGAQTALRLHAGPEEGPAFRTNLA